MDLMVQNCPRDGLLKDQLRLLSGKVDCEYEEITGLGKALDKELDGGRWNKVVGRRHLLEGCARCEGLG
jgi:hypothetical protein